MGTDREKAAKSTQEQAAASWIQYLNQLRAQELREKLAQQDISFEEAMKELGLLKASIQELFDSNRGGIKGMHGFIAERMQVYIGNARNLVAGGERDGLLSGSLQEEERRKSIFGI